VVVNDLGGARDGTGASATMASQVVAEIEALGGQAVANHDSVTDPEGCERMVQAAIDRWGRLDVVVNNAGILRDKTFSKMSAGEWSLVVDVHLNGTRNVARAALAALSVNGGAIINTTSYSGMIGNFGQSNYAAAKAGIYGFTRVLALELKRKGITANCVAPVAKTRMTEDIAMVDDDWGPEQISPIVVYLASDLAKNVTGQVFGVQGQRIHLYEVKTNDGVEKEGRELWTATEIAEKFAEITAWASPAAAEAAGDVDVVTDVFSHFPAGFKPSAAAGWSAVIHWVVHGGTDQTVSIKDGAVTASAGLVGAATCTVKADRDVLIAMFKGELDPTKAFMSGKAQADNMGDLMKMAMAFDFAKVAASYAAAAEAGPAADPVTAVFAKIPVGFKPDAAKGWNAVIQWAVAGGPDQTITVADGVATAAEGLVGSPTCTVKVDKDTLVAMFTGELDPTKAFMSGKAQADNMGDLMKLSMAFDFRKVAAAVAADGAPVAAAPEAAPVEDAGPKVMPIGKRYEGGFAFVDRADFQAYAAATDDPNPAYEGADAVAPPMYHVKPFISLMMKLATDPELELDLLRLVHGEHDVTFHAPLRHGDLLQLRGTLRDVQEKSSGRVVTFGLYGFVDGALAIEGTTTYFIRGKSKGGAKKPKAAPAEAPPAPDLTVEQAVTADQADRYAVASGDDNPIHVNPETAKAAGLPGVILHGLCTMAFAQRDLIRDVAGGDPTRLRRLAVRFARPVFPGSTLTLKAWRGEDGQVAFVTENADGQLVIANGRAVVAE
jgi:NAD(P)-dependent dehydrogenase (short-subunit alcohol dehydrogenase family)/acyl dehydratase/putative sterol carrier protein